MAKVLLQCGVECHLNLSQMRLTFLIENLDTFGNIVTLMLARTCFCANSFCHIINVGLKKSAHSLWN